MEKELIEKLEEIEKRLRKIEKLISDPTLETINNNLHIIAREIRSLKR